MNLVVDQNQLVRDAIDRLEIAELYSKYAMALDDQNLELLAVCFTEGVEFIPGKPDAPTRKGIKENQTGLFNVIAKRTSVNVTLQHTL